MEQCAICLENLVDQVIGIPEHCKHKFCFQCLSNWTQQSNSCPHDRQAFTFILKKYSISSRRPYAKVNITNLQAEILLEDFIKCDACGEEDRDDRPLLTCNRCRKSYHKICLNSLNVSKLTEPICECVKNDRRTSKSGKKRAGAKPSKKRTNESALRDQIRLGRIMKAYAHFPYSGRGDFTTRSITSYSKRFSTTSQTQEKNNSGRSTITPREAVRRIIASGLPICPSPELAALENQKKSMAELRIRRKMITRLPPKISTNELPRIPRRTDAPSRPPIAAAPGKLNPLVKASFMDKLLHSQNQLHSSKNIQIQGPNIIVS